jgi:uncharacterized protein (TIGR03437 family)
VDTPFDRSFGVATSAGTVFASTGGGIWASGDAGITWNLILPNVLTNQVAADPSQPNVIIAGNVRTEDGGATWTPLTIGRQINALIFDPANPGRAIAATTGAAAGFVAKLGYAGEILAATYISSPGGASVAGVAADPGGNIYAAGWSGGQNFFATKYDSGLNRVYTSPLSTFRYVNGIAVDPTGSAAIVGVAPKPPNSQWQCLVTRLAPDGSAGFTTFFGSNSGDNCNTIAADASGNSIVGGFIGVGSVLTKLDVSGNVVFSQSIDAANRFGPNAVVTDAAGNIYVSGTTSSKNFPTTPGAYQAQVSSNCTYPSSIINTGIIGTITTFDNSDTYVQKLEPNGGVIFSTLLGGGCLDYVTGMAVDGAGNVWVAGRTNSSPFPQVDSFESGPAYSFYKGFVSELDPAGSSLKLSSYITAGDQPVVAVDGFGNAYVAGASTPPLSPVSGPCCVSPPANVRASLTKLQSQPVAPLAITGAGNAFTLRDGPVSPGQITLITATGLTPDSPQDLTLTPSAPLPRALSGTQVLFDGEAAVLVSVAAGRVVAVAPYDLAGKQQTNIQVVFQGTLSAPVLADVLADPGYLSRDGSGTGFAYAINPDGTMNSPDNPAPQKSFVTVYATGTGKVDPTCPEGGVGTSPAGYLCGIFPTQIATPNYQVSTAGVPNSPLTIAVK